MRSAGGRASCCDVSRRRACVERRCTHGDVAGDRRRRRHDRTRRDTTAAPTTTTATDRRADDDDHGDAPPRRPTPPTPPTPPSCRARRADAETARRHRRGARRAADGLRSARHPALPAAVPAATRTRSPTRRPTPAARHMPVDAMPPNVRRRADRPRPSGTATTGSARTAPMLTYVAGHRCRRVEPAVVDRPRSVARRRRDRCVIVDIDTGERVPLWAELDAQGRRRRRPAARDPSGGRARRGHHLRGRAARAWSTPTATRSSRARCSAPTATAS